MAILVAAVLLVVGVQANSNVLASNAAAASARHSIRAHVNTDDRIRQLRSDIGRNTRRVEVGDAVEAAVWADLRSRLAAFERAESGTGSAAAAAKEFVLSGKALIRVSEDGGVSRPMAADFAAKLRTFERSRDRIRDALAQQEELFTQRSVDLMQRWTFVLLMGVTVAAAILVAFALWLRGGIVLPILRIAEQLESPEENVPHLDRHLERDDEIGVLARAAHALRQAITERQEAARFLAHAARHDALTGLLGRQAFDEALERLLAEAADDEELALFTVDLDRFKDINDTRGHAEGDAVLRRVANVLRTVCQDDLVGRLGGDEFVILQRHGAQPAAAQDLADRLLEAFRRAELGASIGIALYPRDATEEARLRHYSDLALYRAKHDGRGRARFFGTSRDRDVGMPAYVPLPSELGSAIASDQLRLHYQPKMRARSGEIEGVEALVRWQHPTRGLVAPDIFIPVAEKMGHIRALTEWTIEQACRHQCELAAGGQDVPIYVNISACLLGNPAFARTALHLVSDRFGTIGFEITETGVIEDPQHALAHLQDFVDAGLRIAIDDYGAGMSSLSYLKQLPAHELKIDRAFVGELSRSHRDPLIVRSTIDLAHALGLEVTAEGVEKLSSFALLRAMGCDLIQGYLVARPMTLDALTIFLADKNALSHLGGGEFDISASQSW